MLNCSIEGRVDQLLRNHIEDKVERQLFSLERDWSTTCLLKTRLLVNLTVQCTSSIEHRKNTVYKRQGCCARHLVDRNLNKLLKK